MIFLSLSIKPLDMAPTWCHSDITTTGNDAMFETHDNDPHTRHAPRLDPHRTAGALLCIVAAALVVAVLAALIMSGADNCPADLGATAVRGIDGRTVCVVHAR